MNKTTLSADTGALLLLAVMLYFCREAALPVLCAVTLHEAGHLGALLLFGCPVYEVRASFAGMEIRYEESALGVGQRCFSLLAGPAANLLGAALAPGRFCAPALLLGLFNLLPIRELDGGRALSLVASPGAIRIADTLAIGAFVLFSAAEGMTVSALPVSLWLIFSRTLAKIP